MLRTSLPPTYVAMHNFVLRGRTCHFYRKFYLSIISMLCISSTKTYCFCEKSPKRFEKSPNRFEKSPKCFEKLPKRFEKSTPMSLFTIFWLKSLYVTCHFWCQLTVQRDHRTTLIQVWSIKMEQFGLNFFILLRWFLG
jgi:hypothetical protein